MTFTLDGSLPRLYSHAFERYLLDPSFPRTDSVIHSVYLEQAR